MNKNTYVVLALMVFSSFSELACVKKITKVPPPTELNHLFNENKEGVREGPRTDGIMVMQDNKVIFEKYARGYGPEQKHILWSISKTITALLYGVALKEKKINLDQSICDFVSINPSAKCLIKIRDLLTWSSSLYWSEEYENTAELRKSSVIAMLYGEGTHGMAEFVKSQPVLPDVKPGEVWRYSSGDTLLASHVLEGIYKGKNLRQVFSDKIFTPMGITNWACESDDHGVLGGAFYFYLTLPDLLKVGELILSNGKFNGREIIKPDFFKFMKEIPPAFKLKRLDYKGPHIAGAHLWLNDPKDTGLNSPWPNAPLDTVVAMGHWGQYLVIVPSLKLIAARVADTRDGSIKIKDFVELASHFARTKHVSIVTNDDDETHKDETHKDVADHNREYRDGRIALGLAFTAKNFCSCLFIVQNTEERCRDYASLAQISPTLSVDYEARRTKSNWFYLFRREAQYFDNEKSCRLVGEP